MTTRRDDPTVAKPLTAAERRAHTLAARTESLLAAHVPLSLLLDLADPAGPHSDDLLTAEPGRADWLPGF